MSFQYDKLNPAVTLTAMGVFSRPSKNWTEHEYKEAVMIIAAMRIVADQSDWAKSSPDTDQPKEIKPDA